MVRVNKILSGAVLLLTAMGFASCEKQSSYNYPDTASAYGILFDDESFTYFKYIVDRAGLADRLDGDSEFTLFVPTDRSFQQHGYTFDALRNSSAAELDALVRNHLVPGKIDIISEGTTTLTADNGFEIQLERIDDNSYVDGGDVTNPNQTTTNGYLNVINKVLTARPTLRTIIEKYESSNSDLRLSLFSAAVRHASRAWPGLLDLLDKGGPYTLFVPNNAALIDAGYESIEAIQSEAPEVLANMIRYQLFEGRRLATGFDSIAVSASNGVPVYFDRIKDSKTTFWYANGITFGNQTPSNLIADNGVVHMVARVFPAPISSTTMEYIVSTPELSMFHALIERASEANEGPDFVQMLAGSNTSYTVFAVNNAGMEDYGFADEAAIRASSPDAMARILKFHILPKRMNNVNVNEGNSVATLLKRDQVVRVGETHHTIVFERENGFHVKGATNRFMVPVLTGNVVTTNGLLNIIGEVLTP